MGRAMGRFSMLRRGDKIAVAVSGGKDSLSLLHGLVAYRKRTPFPYDLVAVTLEQGKFKLPIRALEDKIRGLGVEWILREDTATLSLIAENVPQPTPIPPELTKLEQTLKDLFGYNQFEVIGQSDKTLKTGQEDWLANSKYFGLHVDARGENDAGYTLNLKLYKENDVLLETDANLSKSSPLVIKGPQVGSGQLLLVLVVKDDEQAHRHRHAEPANPITAGWYRLRRIIHNALP